MKLTKELLQKIIKEELDDLEEAWWNPFSKKKKPEPEPEPEREPEPEPEPEPELSRAQRWSQDLKFDITDKDLDGAGKYGMDKEKDLQMSFAMGHLEGQGGREPSHQECYEAGVDCIKIRKRVMGAGISTSKAKSGGYGAGSSGYTTKKDWDSPFRESKQRKRKKKK